MVVVVAPAEDPVVPAEDLVAPAEDLVAPAEDLVAPADPRPVFVTETWAASEEAAEVVVAAEVPCAEVPVPAEGIPSVSDPAPREILNPLELSDVRPTSPGLINVVITMTTRART